MNLEKGLFGSILTITAMACLSLMSCGDGNNPSNNSPTLGAPGIISPGNGGQVETATPTLTANNVTVTGGTGTPTYTFQVATDSAFTNILVQASVPQGAGSQTSWVVTATLSNGEHFWRAQAALGSTTGPFSAVVSFTVAAPFTPTGTVLVSDPLTGGSTMGSRSGGAFGANGWRVTNPADFIRYDVPAITNGYVEWDNRGLNPKNRTPDQFMMLGMWDPTAGDYRTNPFRVHVQKLHPNPHNPPYLRVRWIAQGEEHDEGSNFTSWDPGTTYRWRLQWGPAAGAFTTKLFLDGNEVVQVRYGRNYAPNRHWIELGIADRGESVVDAVYANVLIGRN